MDFDGDDSRPGRATQPSTDDNSSTAESSIDVEELSDVLDRHPVRLAVLFGSFAKEAQHVDSDVDVAIEFEQNTDPEDALLPLVADLSRAVDGKDVDVGILSDLEPRVGVAACRNGVILVGNQDRVEHHSRRFREQLQDEKPRPARDRFREIVETARRAVGSDA